MPVVMVPLCVVETTCPSTTWSDPAIPVSTGLHAGTSVKDQGGCRGHYGFPDFSIFPERSALSFAKGAKQFVIGLVGQGGIGLNALQMSLPVLLHYEVKG